LQQIDRIGLLPFVVGLVRSPFDEARPAGQRGQVAGEKIGPCLRRNAERVETVDEGIIRPRRQRAELAPAGGDPAGGAFLRGEPSPGAEETPLPSGHRPGGVAFVEKRLAPLDHFPVDPFGQVGAEYAVAPGGHCLSSAEAGPFAIDHGRHVVADGGDGDRGGQMAGQRPDAHAIGMAGDDGVECVFSGRGDAMEQMGAQHLGVGHLACADGHPLVLHERLKRSVEMVGCDPAVFQIVPVGPVGQIALAAQQPSGAPDGVVEVQILQAVQRVVVDEGPHGPVGGDDLAGNEDQPAQVHPPGVGIAAGLLRRRGWCCHGRGHLDTSSNTLWVLCVSLSTFGWALGKTLQTLKLINATRTRTSEAISTPPRSR